MSHPTPTIPTLPDDDEDNKEENIRPMDWLFCTDFLYRRFILTN